MSDLRLAAPIGFLALIGLIILILIYILKPNYQQKFISSTFIWKLSLKFKKRKFPMSRLRNLLIIICQVLIIVLSAVLLTQPFLDHTKNAPPSEEIIIVDASVNMMAKQGTDVSRFERTIEQVTELSDAALGSNKSVTIIMAGTTADYLSYDETVIVNGEETTQTVSILHCKDKSVLKKALEALITKDQNGNVVAMACDYTGADMDGALKLANTISSGNAGAMVTIYTGKNYSSRSQETYKSVNGQRAKFRIINVGKYDAEKYDTEKEWNAAILSCSSVRNDNGAYRFTVDVACYNNDLSIPVMLEIYGADGGTAEDVFKNIPAQTAVCRDEKTVTVTFEVSVRSLIYARVYIMENDSFSLDNSFYHYGSGKNPVEVIYISPSHSNQLSTIAQSFYALRDQWEFNIRTTSLRELEAFEQDISRGGYDLYLIEHIMPAKFPVDGIVMIISPEDEITDLGVLKGDLVTKMSQDPELCTLTSVSNSQLINFVHPEKLVVNQYYQLTSYSGYDVLLTVRDLAGNPDPAYLVNETRKIAIITFASIYSDYTVRNEFGYIYYNLLKAWLPATINEYVYDVGETIGYWQTKEILKEYSPEITIKLSDGSYIDATDIDSYYVSQSIYGNYTITQRMHSGKVVTETYFVKIAEEESRFSIKTEIQLSSIVIPRLDIDDPIDLFIYIGIALIVLVFIERLLHVKSEF